MTRLPPRVVLYTDDLEAITIIDLPLRAREHLERHGRLVIELIRPMKIAPEIGADIREEAPARVELWSELFVRKDQRHFFLFTRDDENALLLRAAFLPGQQATLANERVDAFRKGWLSAMEAFR